MTVATGTRDFVGEWERLRDKQVEERRQLVAEAVKAGERVHIVCYHQKHQMIVATQFRGALVASTIEDVPEDELRIKYFDLHFEY